MILKASCRATPLALGRHLTNEKDNDHIEQHEVRGFMADDVMGAMQEVHALSKGVKSNQPLFSISLSPPEQEQVGVEVFERTIERIEQENGLGERSRIVVFHEKEGRRHCHAVWSRIDPEHMRVVPLPFYKSKLQEIAKATYLEQGWDLPKGFIDKRQRDPRNFDLALYNQAKAEGRDPKQIKMLAQEAWSISDNREAFQQALQERGLYLTKGDRRGFVALNWQGKVMSLQRLLGCKSKELRERLGKTDELRSVEETQEHIAKTVAPTLVRLIGEAQAEQVTALEPLVRDRQAMTLAHAEERYRMDVGQKARWQVETQHRAARMSKGLGGLWDRLSGRYAKLKDQNEREAWQALQRDRQQRQDMIAAQLREKSLQSVACG